MEFDDELDAVTGRTDAGTWPLQGDYITDGSYTWLVAHVGELHALGNCRWVRVVFPEQSADNEPVADCIVEPEVGSISEL